MARSANVKKAKEKEREGLSEELALEVASFGVRVVVVEPGITKSAIFAKNTEVPHETGAYDAHNRRMLQFYASGIPQATDPMEVAEVVYEAVTDPEVPPLPPHIKMDQAVSLNKALLRGDPNAARILKQSFKGKLHEFVTR